MKRREQEESAARWVRSVLARSATAKPEETGPESWQAAWEALDLPAGPPAPAGFARRVARAWQAEQATAAAPILGAGWMRAAALAALLAGIALGSTLSDASAPSDGSTAADDSWSSTSLSEEYLSALSSPEGVLASPVGEDDAAADLPAGEP